MTIPAPGPVHTVIKMPPGHLILQAINQGVPQSQVIITAIIICHLAGAHLLIQNQVIAQAEITAQVLEIIRNHRTVDRLIVSPRIADRAAIISHLTILVAALIPSRVILAPAIIAADPVQVTRDPAAQDLMFQDPVVPGPAVQVLEVVPDPEAPAQAEALVVVVKIIMNYLNIV